MHSPCMCRHRATHLNEVNVAIGTHAGILRPRPWRLPHQDAVVHALGHDEVAHPPHAVDVSYMHLRSRWQVVTGPYHLHDLRSASGRCACVWHAWH